MTETNIFIYKVCFCYVFMFTYIYIYICSIAVNFELYDMPSKVADLTLFEPMNPIRKKTLSLVRNQLSFELKCAQVYIMLYTHHMDECFYNLVKAITVFFLLLFIITVSPLMLTPRLQGLLLVISGFPMKLAT